MTSERSIRQIEWYFDSHRRVNVDSMVAGGCARGPILTSKNLPAESKITQHLIESLPLQDKNKADLTIKKHQEITTEDGKTFIADISGIHMPSGDPAWVAIVNDVSSSVSHSRVRLGICFSIICLTGFFIMNIIYLIFTINFLEVHND